MLSGERKRQKLAISGAWNRRTIKGAEWTADIVMVPCLVEHGFTYPPLPHHDLMQNNPLTATLNNDSNVPPLLSHELSRTI